MKSLTNFIQENYFYDETYYHLILSLGEFYEKRFFEGKTPPQWLKEDARYIKEEILKRLKINNKTNFNFEINLSELKNGSIFTKLTILVKFVKSNNYIEGAVTIQDIYNSDVELEIQIPAKIENAEDIDTFDLTGAIAHELLHRYVYFLNGTDEYSKSFFSQRLNRISYNKLFSYKSELENFVKGLIYYTNTDEFNAFFNQLAIEFEKTSCITADQTYEVLKNNQIYQIYLYLKQTLEKEYIKERQEICDIYRSLVISDKKLSNKRIIYKLKERLKKLERKLWKELPRFCMESKLTSKIKMREFILSLGEKFGFK